MEPVVRLGAAVGIDLGTSNTVVAHVEDGRAQALADGASKDVLIPSVATFHPSGAVLVGREAKERRLQDPKNTVFSAKRLIGRAWTSKEVGQARVRLPYELREGKNASVVVHARNKDYTLPEVSAFVLRKAKAIGEAALRTKIDRAVITCPANFDDLQRGATKLAGQLAGLEVLRVLNEPTAAALAYGYGKEGQERILVYDFGGGTFDVTVLERVGDVFQVRSTAGDMYLGGDDVDQAIANRMSEGFAAKHFYDPRADRQVFEHVREAAEKLKVKLASAERANIVLEDVAFGVGGKSLRFEFEMQQKELSELVDPLVERTLKVVKRALENAGLAAREMDQVILVGGTTLIGRVRERVSDFFGRDPATGLSPFEAVAIGAAIQAYAMTEATPDDVTEATAASVRLSRQIVTLRPPPPVLEGAPSLPSAHQIVAASARMANAPSIATPSPGPAAPLAPGSTPAVVTNVPAPLDRSAPRAPPTKPGMFAGAPEWITWAVAAGVAVIALVAWLLTR